MKILQVVKTNIGANWAFTQAKWLSKNGVDIISVLPSTEGGLAEEYKMNGLKVVKGDFTLPTTKPWKLIGKIKEINHIVDEIKPDIIHCHFVTNIMMVRVALRKSNIPRLFQVPGPLHLENKLFRKAEISLTTKSDYWAGACKKTCDIYLSESLPQNKVFLAYYGGYGGLTCNDYKERTHKLHDEYNIPSEKILIGMVSYFYKPKMHLLQTRGLKGHEDFIDAISIARKQNPKIIGVIIGDAWGDSHNYVKKVKAYAASKCPDGILFTGFRTDIKEIYKELDIAVHPSHSENLGGAAESLAAGVPTISTNVGGFPDIVINGDTGYTVERKKPVDLAKAIFRMLNNDRKSIQMGQNGQKLVKKMLDIENTSKEIKCIYERILRGR